MAAVDWICLAVLLASLLLGAWRGLVYEVLAVAGWVIAFLAARWSADVVGQWLPMGESSEPLRYAAAFVLVFIGVAFLCGMLATLARRATRSLGARPVDRVFGGAFGVLRGLLVLLVAAALLRATPLRDEAWWRQSVSAQWLEMTLAQLQPLLPDELGKHLSA
ncbi:CvpA family protein [Ottowia sp.]|uniref:CvpA family protein n=1 Tax=Ottowia sp. TaxID=1898956 RepID=UPI002BB5A7D9|nr:CvpA family protein [Ottowia sp.]HRN76873.1 CvpA family protein [Ottowia sp.]HRQ03821.1 CvpA family protein [Ottowia sp.]